MALKRYTLCVTEEMYEKIYNICKIEGKGMAEVTRELIEKGLAYEWVDKNTELISMVVRRQLENVLKPHVERLAALESKTGHAAATSMFLNVQAFMDLVDEEKRRIPKEMYERARKKAVEYMRTPLSDLENDKIVE